MIDEQTYKDIKLYQKQGHSFTYITMALELEDDTVKIAMNTHSYAEFEQAMQAVV